MILFAVHIGVCAAVGLVKELRGSISFPKFYYGVGPSDSQQTDGRTSGWIEGAAGAETNLMFSLTPFLSVCSLSHFIIHPSISLSPSVSSSSRACVVFFSSRLSPSTQTATLRFYKIQVPAAEGGRSAWRCCGGPWGEGGVGGLLSGTLGPILFAWCRWGTVGASPRVQPPALLPSLHPHIIRRGNGDNHAPNSHKPI